MENPSSRCYEELAEFGYQPLALLGNGAWASVVKCVEVESGKPVAIKVIWKRNLNDEEWQKIAFELEAMTSLDHENIIKLLNMHETYHFVYYVLEYCGGGDALALVQSRDHLSETETRVLFRQLVSAIDYAHKRGFVHRDIKLENLFLTNDGSLRVGDWGFARRWSEDGECKESFGSLHYAAPEICSGKGYKGPEVDVWSMGVTLYSLVSGFMPFHAPEDALLLQKIKSGVFTMHKDFSPNIKDLLRGMLAVDQKKRLTLPEVMKHPWYVGRDPATAPLRRARSFIGKSPSLTREGDSERRGTVSGHEVIQIEDTKSNKKPQIPKLNLALCKPFMADSQDFTPRYHLPTCPTKKLVLNIPSSPKEVTKATEEVANSKEAAGPKTPRGSQISTTPRDSNSTLKQSTNTPRTPRSVITPRASIATISIPAEQQTVNLEPPSPKSNVSGSHSYGRNGRSITQLTAHLAEVRKSTRTKEKLVYFLKNLLGPNKPKTEVKKRLLKEEQEKRKSERFRYRFSIKISRLNTQKEGDLEPGLPSPGKVRGRSGSV